MESNKGHARQYKKPLSLWQRVQLLLNDRFKHSDVEWVVRCGGCKLFFIDLVHGYSGPFMFHECPVCGWRLLFL